MSENGAQQRKSAGESKGWSTGIRAYFEWSPAWVVVFVLALIVALASVVPSPYVIERPGPVINALGSTEIDDRDVPVIAIGDEVESYPTEGTMNLLTVNVLGDPDNPVAWLELLPALFRDGNRIAPMSEFYPEGVSADDRKSVNAALMSSSQDVAAAVAFRETGVEVPIVLTVAEVTGDGPAAGLLKEGDVIVAANGLELGDFEALRKEISATEGENKLTLTVSREGSNVPVTLTPELDAETGEPRIGVVISTTHDLPADVTISLADVGGPSAGLAFSLAVYDALTPEDEVRGQRVNVTGTMSDDGAVGAIGGLEQKMWGASQAGGGLFLMPVENCNDVPSRLPPNLTVVPVSTFAQAVEAMASTEVVEGGSAAAISERCTTS